MFKNAKEEKNTNFTVPISVFQLIDISKNKKSSDDCLLKPPPNLDLYNEIGYEYSIDLCKDFHKIVKSEEYSHYNISVINPPLNHIYKCKIMYINSQKPKLGFFLLGNVNFVLDLEIDPNRFIITPNLVSNFHLMKNEVDISNQDMMNTLGSILSINDWSYLMNDAFILGGISTRCHFHLYTPRSHISITTKTTAIFNSIKVAENALPLRLTIYAREIIACLAAGYEIKNLSDGTEILVPSDNIRGLTVSELISAVTHF